MSEELDWIVEMYKPKQNSDYITPLKYNGKYLLRCKRDELINCVTILHRENRKLARELKTAEDTVVEFMHEIFKLKP